MLLTPLNNKSPPNYHSIPHQPQNHPLFPTSPHIGHTIEIDGIDCQGNSKGKWSNTAKKSGEHELKFGKNKRKRKVKKGD
jgi:hypothetical protein